MKPETINKKFNETTELPTWAQDNQDVAYWCKHDLSFRSDVFNATPQDRNRLRREAERRNNQ